jgi:competence protein ComEA
MRIRISSYLEIGLAIAAAVVALTVAKPAFAATVNVNTAQQSELQRVKGLDKAKAKAIIDYRHQAGFYRSLADLEKVPGMSHEVVARASPGLAFSGDSYVPGKPVAVASKEPARKEPPKRLASNP